MDAATVYDFGSYHEYLRAVAARTFSTGRRKFRLAPWAEKLGYRSPRTIAMVLKGQRLPSAEMMLRVSRVFQHSESEHHYLDLLVQRERNRRRGRDVSLLTREIERLNPRTGKNPTIDRPTFAYIAQWYHFVIKQLIETPDFREDPTWISWKLRGRVSRTEVIRAIERMLEVGVLRRSETGRLEIQKKKITTPCDVPDDALRRHHRGMIRQALESIQAPDFNNREITSVTLRIDPHAIPAAKEEIRRFRDAFNEKFDSGDSGHVYQLNLQFFEHTRPI